MATTATALDPTFVKALRLLQSKSKDSTAQLRAMLDEAIAIRKGNAPPKPPRSPNSRLESGRSQSRDRVDSFEKEADKRKDLDRLKTDLSQLEPKRPRLESPALSNSSHESVGPGSPQGSEGSQGEFGDLQMNIELDCTCIICKSFNQESNNKLMECSTCQNLYHQECHDPPVLNFDPRIIWNCSRCTRKASPSRSSSSSSRSTSVEKTSKSQDKSSHKSSGSKSGNSQGRPSPAKHSASSGSSKHKSSHNTGAAHTTSSSSGSLQMTEAQKRLKLMKRQAAAASHSIPGKKKSK